MKLMEEAPHVNRIVKTLIDEYAFVMNVRVTSPTACTLLCTPLLPTPPPLAMLQQAADVPLCIMEEDSGWAKRGSRTKKSGRAKSDPIHTPLSAARGYGLEIVAWSTISPS